MFIIIFSILTSLGFSKKSMMRRPMRRPNVRAISAAQGIALGEPKLGNKDYDGDYDLKVDRSIKYEGDSTVEYIHAEVTYIDPDGMPYLDLSIPEDYDIEADVRYTKDKYGNLVEIIDIEASY